MSQRTYAPEVLEYLSQFDSRLFTTTEGRRALTRLNPKLFCIVYLLRHMTDENGHVSFSEVHEDWFTHMTSWAKPAIEPRDWRRAFVAPRSTGKTTMWFLAAPLWAGAHGHARFVAAFADSATQAETHLATFKAELDNNPLLRRDFPELCTASKRPSGFAEADNRNMFKAKKGFVFVAKGIDSSSLGLKVGDQRPDVIIGDDLEPPESNYSAGQADKRLSTLVNAILPLNERARVVLVGTVTMPESIIHQLVKTVTTTDVPAQWVLDEKFKCYYYPAIQQNEDGTERSIWEAKWPIEWLQSIRHTRSYLLNYENNPAGADGAYWTLEDFTYGPIEGATRTLLSIDPAITTKSTSDYTGIAVVTASRLEKKCCVEFAEEVRLTGSALRDHVLKLLERYPHIALVLVEVNQGGAEIWPEILHHLPVRIKVVHQSVKKEVRAAECHTHYQRGRVTHLKPLPRAENQMISFPKAPHDDIVDAITTAVNFFLKEDRRAPAGVVSLQYATPAV